MPEGFDNRLVFGDNLLALKALEQEFTGKVKCIYIDPPFNTGTAFEHYDDGLEHSLWLTMMRDRLQMLKALLRPDGAIFVHLDDNESDYLRIVMDEIFGRRNFVGRITLQARSPSAFSTVNPGVFKASEYLLWYANDKTQFQENRVRVPRDPDTAYNRWLDNPEDPCRDWQFTSLSDAFERYGKDTRKNAFNKFIVSNADKIFRLTSISESGAGKATIQAKRKSEKRPGEVVTVIRENFEPQYILDGQQMSFYARNVFSIDGVLTASALLTNIWTDIAWEGIAGEGKVTFKKGKKPERLIKRILELSTNPGDLVLDSFAGSGTTGAVAHKMGRRWIMVELGDHCNTHIVPRMRRVVDGTDQTGISKAVGWEGGGGFRYQRLAPSLLEKDKWGNWVINNSYNPEMLAEAMCRHEGFTYAPSETVYWRQGYSTETDFIYTTTQSLTREQLQNLSDEVGEGRTLLVCCSAFRADSDEFPNLTVRKIPRSVLSRCEFGRDDYSFEVNSLPEAPPENLFESAAKQADSHEAEVWS